MKVWAWLATLYLVGLPCLYWRGVLQDQALAVVYPMATVALAGWSFVVSHRVVVSEVVGWLVLGVVASSVFTMPAAGFPVLVLHAGLALLAFWSLSHAPSADWLERRIVWLALINAAYAWVQWAGYDPLFESVQAANPHLSTGVPGPIGLFSRRNQLGMLLLAAFPLASTWQRGVLVATAAMVGSWVAVGGIGLWWLSRRVNPWVVGVVAAVGLVCGGVTSWDSRFLPRVSVRLVALGEAVWSPLYGYGLGAWEAMHSEKLGLGPWLYNSYLSAFHMGGVLVLLPLVGAVWMVWRSRASRVKEALLLLGLAALVQTPWHFIRLVIVTVALGAAWNLRRMDAD